MTPISSLGRTRPSRGRPHRACLSSVVPLSSSPWGPITLPAPPLLADAFPPGPSEGSAREKQEASPQAPTHQCSILVVDDDSVILDMLSETLDFDGHRVSTARDGLEALAAVERTIPEIVLLDMRMPNMDGWAFVRAIRARDLDIKIVVMTAALDARRWAAEVGATAYLAKPFGAAQVLDVIDKLCEGLH